MAYSLTTILTTTHPIRCSLYYSVLFCHEFCHQLCSETEALQKPIALSEYNQPIMLTERDGFLFFIRKALT